MPLRCWRAAHKPNALTWMHNLLNISGKRKIPHNEHLQHILTRSLFLVPVFTEEQNLRLEQRWKHLAMTSGNSSISGFGARFCRGLPPMVRRDLSLRGTSLTKLMHTVIRTKFPNFTVIVLLVITINYAAYREIEPPLHHASTLCDFCCSKKKSKQQGHSRISKSNVIDPRAIGYTCLPCQ